MAVTKLKNNGDKALYYIPLNKNTPLLDDFDYAGDGVHPTQEGSRKIAEYLKDKEAYKERYKDNPGHIKYLEEEFPLKLRWTDEECYKDVVRYEEPEDIMPDGSIKHHYNPNAKWDWYSIGGRWCGSLYVDENYTDGTIGEMSWTYEGDKNAAYGCEYPGYKRVDGAFLKDVNFPNTQQEIERAKRFWEIYIEGDNPKDDDEKALVEHEFWKREYYLENYKTKDNYIKANSGLILYGVVTKDGKWYEKGQMGWWGIASNEDCIGWPDTFKKLIWGNVEDGDYITVLDCHV